MLRVVPNDDDDFIRNTRKRETDAERIARYGFDPFVHCSWCGDTGISPDTNNECFCAIGVGRAEISDRELRWLGLVPRRFHDYTLNQHPNAKLAEEVGAWIDSNPCRTGENLIIKGATGRGKTGAAIGAIRELHFQGAAVRYWSLPDLLDQLRADEFERNSRKPTMEQLTECDCLLLDDMGTERTHSAYVIDRLYVLINGRYTLERPTIITTNLTAKFEEYLGERVASRLNENARHVTAKGFDLRRKNQ